MICNYKRWRILFQTFLIYFVSSGIWTSCLAQGTIYVSGTLTGKTTWSADTVKVTGSVSVDTLVIEPGTVVVFQGEFGLSVEKYLNANGEIGDTILFTVNDTTGFSNPDSITGGWGGIGGRGKIILKYCKIQYVKKSNIKFGAVNGRVSTDILHSCITNNYSNGVSSYSGNLNISNSSITNNKGIGIQLEFSTVNIHDCIIGNNSGGGIYSYSYGKFYVENSTVESNGNYGIKAYESSICNIIRNIIQNNHGSGIKIQDYEFPFKGIALNNIIRFNNEYGITISTGHIPIINNLIFGNNKAGVRLLSVISTLINNTIINNSNGITIYDAGIQMYNCICRDNNTREGEQNMGIRRSHCNIYNSNIEGINSDDFGGEFVNNIDTDPQFVDTANFDFHLSDSSPCVNTGTPDTTGLFLPQTDVEGKPRITNGWIDMGAYELSEFPGNQPPLIERIQDQMITPGTTKSFIVKYIDPDPGDQAFLLNVSSNIPEIQIHDIINNSTYVQFSITIDRTWQGNGEIQIQVTDNHGIIGVMKFPVLISKEVCGTIVENTLWDNDTIKVICDVKVKNDVTLTIKPGTVIAFANNCRLNVYGSIVAIGNRYFRITFTSTDTTGFYNQTYEGWKGIRLNGNGNAEFRYCDFLFARNEDNGGALSDIRGSVYPLTITNCNFNHNFSQQNGGAIYRQYNILEFKNNAFFNNRANHFGGAIYFNDKNSDIINNLFINNQAEQGAAIYIESEYGSNRLINNTIVGNKAEISGGGLSVNNGSIINCILWGNEAGASGREIKIRGSGTISNCIIDDGINGITYSKYDSSFLSDIYSSDPNFVSLQEFDFHLTDSSIAINTGTIDTSGLSLPLCDLDGNTRIYTGINRNIDIGAYEFQHDPINRKPIILFPAKLYLNISSTEREVVNFLDPDTDDTHTLSITSNNENLQILDVSGDTSGSYFDLLSTQNWKGRAIITIKAEDNYGNIGEHTCEVLIGHLACGIIANNTIWNADTIHVICDVTVSKNAVLTIMPGTVVLFHGYRTLNVMGDINAIGTLSDKIIFTTEDSTGFYFDNNSDKLSENFGWNGLLFDNFMNDTVTSVFKHCIFKYSSNSTFYTKYYKGIEINECEFRYNNIAVYSRTTNLLIKNCIFTHNYGTVIYTRESSKIDSCIFSNNISGNVIIYTENGDQIITHCLFDSNYVINGSCINFYYDIHGNNSRISSNVFSNNKVESGVVILYSGVLFDNNLVCKNNSIHNLDLSNRASGGVKTYGSPVLINNTIVYNSVANGGGGGLFIDKKSDPVVYNTILYGNTSDGSDNQIHSDYDGEVIPDVKILFSDLQGGIDGITGNLNILQYENNLDADPILLADTLTRGTFNPAFLGLSDLSLCINAGTIDTTGLNLPQLDLAGNPRVFDGRIDMGAFEYQQDNFHILKQPVSQVICEGAPAILETEAIGGVVGYQWQKNGADIPSANQSSFAIDSVSLNDSGSYNCMIIADDKTVSTDTIVLSIDTGITLESQSDSFSICPGLDTLINVTVSGGNRRNYSWSKNDSILPDAAEPELIITSPANQQQDVYVCTVSNACGSVVSGKITVASNIPDPPVSSDVTICEGQPVPDLIASGDHIKWYSDDELTNPVYSGNNFNTGHSNHGLYVYYVSQTVSGCESNAGTVKLTINMLPVISLGEDSTISTNQNFMLGPYTNSYSYLWNDHSENAYLEISGNVLGTGNHTISVVVTDTNTCQNSDTMIVHVVPYLNIGLTQNNNRIHIFPVPSDGLLNIEVSDFHDEDIIVKLFNQRGEEILSDKIRIENKGGTIQLNVTSLPAGVYYLQIITNNRQYVGKVVLQ